MSNSLVRRNSSKQGLQNLMRLMAQRSIEDAEEMERERRRRARETLHRRNSGSTPKESSPEGEMQAEESMYDDGQKQSSSSSLEEDEGFSDWTQHRERRRQQRLQELSQGGEEDDDKKEDTINKTVPTKTAHAPVIFSRQRLEQEKKEWAEMERRKEHEEDIIRAERVRREKKRQEEQRNRDEIISRRREEIQKPNTEIEKRKEVKVSYASKVFLHQDPKHSNGNVATEEVKAHMNMTKRFPSSAVEPKEAEAILETEHRLGKIRQSLQEKESEELEQLRHRQTEPQQELEEVKKRREERHQVQDEEERCREEEQQQQLAKEEEERLWMKEDIERRRMEAEERSTSSIDEDKMFNPFSPKVPTHEITETTESLNCSQKKSNSFKKTRPLVLLSKTDDKLEQYTHAVEDSQEAQTVKASLTDLPNSPEVVASKKNLFEVRETWSQSSRKAATCKDTAGLKVGVAKLITQWVKLPSNGSSSHSLCRPADVKPGDVMQKKNMWEIIGDSSGRLGQRVKGSAVVKKYKFVVTGHGKYEKISVDDKDEAGFTSRMSDLYHRDY